MPDTQPTGHNHEKETKIPGRLARGYMRFQAITSLIGAVVMPVYTIYAAAKGKISVPFGVSSFTVDISSPFKRSATVVGGLLYSAYMALNGTARLRTAKDTATQEKISLGKLEPENAVFKSSSRDRTLTKVEASISTAIALGSLGYGIHTAINDEASTTKTGSLIFASVSAITAAVMSVVKFRAAKAAEQHTQETEPHPQTASTLADNRSPMRYAQPAPSSGRAR